MNPVAGQLWYNEWQLEYFFILKVDDSLVYLREVSAGKDHQSCVGWLTTNCELVSG
jgi:hypothetical protein